jgi:hypothetical protein
MDAPRIASHNVGGAGCDGLKAFAAQAATTRVDLGLHVIVVQECKLQFAELAIMVACINLAAARHAAASHKPRHLGFEYKYCINLSPEHPHSTGNLILRQRQLVADVSLQVLPETALDTDAYGRLMVLYFKWGGHTMHLMNVYLPNTSVHRQAYIAATFAPLWAAYPTNIIFINDWNFVDDPGVDRRSLSGQPSTSDVPSMCAWQATTPDTADAFGCLHPTRRCYTFIHRHGNPLR